MYIIGITGYSGAGKTTFAKILAQLDKCVGVCHLDEIWHGIIHDNKEWMIEHFSKDVFNDNGSFNADFYNSCNMLSIQEHEAWAIPKMVNKFDEEVNALKGIYDVMIADYATLPNTSIWSKCDTKVFIESDENERYAKLRAREYYPCTPEQAKIRDKKADIAFRKIGTDYLTIHNDYTDEYEKVASDFLNSVFE